MKVIESGRTIEGAHAPGAPPIDAQQLSFERAGAASVDQTDSPADNKTVPTQLAHSGRQRATRTTPKRGTAVGYIRVSTEDQTQGYSLDAQRAGIQEYCERNGYQLVRFYSDEGVSAHTDKISKRPQLSLLLEHAKQEQFDVVVVHTLDRWARNMRVQTEALEILGKARIGFVSVTENVDYTTPEGQLMLTMMGGFAEFYSAQLGRHVEKAMKQRARQGLQNGSVPFGYLKDDKTSIPCPVPKEAEAVRTVFAKRAAGETNGRIAVWLNVAGFRTRRGNPFSDGSVRDMLGFRFYLGVVRLGDEEFHGQHEGIIAPELFERVHTRTVKRGPGRGTAGGREGCLPASSGVATVGTGCRPTGTGPETPCTASAPSSCAKRKASPAPSGARRQGGRAWRRTSMRRSATSSAPSYSHRTGSRRSRASRCRQRDRAFRI